ALCRRPAGAELDVDELDRARLLLERARVGNRQVRPLDQLLELGTAGEAGDAEALDEDRVRSDGADHLAQRLIEPANHRRHADDRRDADDDAEDGQRRAHLVAAYGVVRHHDDFFEEARADRHGYAAPVPGRITTGRTGLQCVAREDTGRTIDSTAPRSGARDLLRRP